MMRNISGQRHSIYEQLRRITPLRLASRFPRALLTAMFESRRGLRTEYERHYLSAQDPWHYAGASQQARHIHALELLRGSGAKTFHNAVELGCGEGVFTERVAPLCKQLLAVDFSPTALQRARQHCSSLGNVSFALFDIRSENVNGEYDLVIAMDIVECLHGPRELRRVCGRIAKAIALGGWLLMTTSRHDDEHTWWSKWLLRGRRITDYMAAQPELAVVCEYHNQVSHGALYQRK